MSNYEEETSNEVWDNRPTTVLSVEQRQSHYQRRSALLSGLLPIDESAAVSTGLSEVIEHREQFQARQTRALSAFIQHELERERHSPPAPAELPPTPAAPAPEPARAGPQEATGRKGTSWRRLLAARRPRRVPVLRQMSAVECGAACIAMLLSYYGRKTSVSEVRERCQVGRDGLSALDIVKAARTYHLRVRAISLQEDDLGLVTLPAIVHWEFNHFVIVERASHSWVEVVDPGLGRRRLTKEEFFKGFTGIVIMLEPGAHFDRTANTRRLRLGSYVWGYLKLAPLSIIQILGASLLLQLFGLAVPLLTAFVVDQILPFKLDDTLTLLAVGLFILMAAQIVTTWLRASVLLYVQTRVDTRMMLGFFEHLLSLPLRFFQQRSSGDMLARLSSNVIIRDTISNQMISTILDGSFVITYLLILFARSAPFGWLVLGLGLAQVCILLASNRVIRAQATRELLAQGKAQGYAAEALVGITTLKAAGAEDRALQRWTNLFFDQMNASVRRSQLSALVETITSNLRAIAPLLLLVIGTAQVLHGSLQAGTMLALVTLASSFLTPLGSLVASGKQMQLVQAHLERVADVLEAEPEQDLLAVKEPPLLTGHIRLEQVSFRYAPTLPPLLHDISLTIQPGQKVAIVGRTGSGKSTLGNLLLGLYLPTSGEVYYDGLPLHTLNYQAVRAQFGVVTQGSAIFSGTIRENVALNQPGMSMEQVIKSASAAAIHDDILGMPMAYETFVAEGGSALSGGQRQRLGLARALATNPVILLLDEATSALDVVTEQAVEQNLRSLRCTQIIIAHRLSTIRNADLILVLDQGAIVERGSHAELLQRQGYYARLIQSQLVNGELVTR
ncbi:MAG TPA: peptidase domain-containing ABC transporter [Ktedonobacterales bacterium]|jgi:ABC-type bacteriocin/lantibiotic exporter with double-glycine peptidase domain